MKTFNHIRIKPITGAMGAEVFDVDLSGDLDDVPLWYRLYSVIRSVPFSS